MKEKGRLMKIKSANELTLDEKLEHDKRRKKNQSGFLEHAIGDDR